MGVPADLWDITFRTRKILEVKTLIFILPVTFYAFMYLVFIQRSFLIIWWRKLLQIFFTSRTSVCISNSSKYFKSKIDRPIDQYKVHIFWEGHKILQNLHLTFDWHYIFRTKVRWRFRKILWPSQNIWTLYWRFCC